MQGHGPSASTSDQSRPYMGRQALGEHRVISATRNHNYIDRIAEPGRDAAVPRTPHRRAHITRIQMANNAYCMSGTTPTPPSVCGVRATASQTFAAGSYRSTSVPRSPRSADHPSHVKESTTTRCAGHAGRAAPGMHRTRRTGHATPAASGPVRAAPGIATRTAAPRLTRASFVAHLSSLSRSSERASLPAWWPHAW